MNWSDYEENVYQECVRVFGNQTLKNVHIKGRYSNRQRQIDVYIPNIQIEGKNISIAVDAKHYRNKVDIKTVESFIGMLQDVNVSKGLIVSSKGYTKTAIQRAQNAPDEVQVEILSVEELETLQSVGVIIYSGKFGFAIKSPFGWIIDGTHRDYMVATVYRAGLNSLDQAGEEKEFMYLNITPKSKTILGIPELLQKQQELEISQIKSVSVEVQKSTDNIIIRYLRTPSYPTVEITGFKEFKDCILFCVLFCPDIMIKRDVEKLKYILNSAIPISVSHS